jgi:4-hydroxythreonine-4-phosphate dehydrogenase
LSFSPDSRPTLALTVGDVTGIGPELVIASLSDPLTYSFCRPVVIGPIELLESRSESIGVSLKFRQVADPEEAAYEFGTVNVLEPAGCEKAVRLPVGEVDPEAGRIVAFCLEKAFELASQDKIQGVVGAPLNKQAFRLGGCNYLDEIAFLAALTHSEEPRLFGILDRLWTTCVTLHVSFKDIAGLITRERVLAAIRAMHDALQRVRAEEPSIAVAALNPHNGEGGLLGSEEIDEIAPAAKDACALGIRVHGPFAADTLFPRAFAENVQGVICMHHDQANVARKLHGFKDSASAFLGLPVPYATTAHGTAFDLVGHGAADPSSYIAALTFVVGQCAPTAGAAAGGTADRRETE